MTYLKDVLSEDPFLLSHYLTCDYELAEKLHKLKAPQNTYFYWKAKLDHGLFYANVTWENYLYDEDQLPTFVCSAYTAVELGRLLPSELHGFQLISSKVDNDHFWLSYTKDGVTPEMWEGRDRSEANLRARLLIFLLENKLISL